MLLQLYNLNDSVTGDPVCILKQGEHIIGRGDLLHCYDKRASRTHGIIKVEGKNATLTSTHQNPCFFQSNNSSTIVILTKDIPAELQDGDKFGIFPEQFWFKTKFQYENASENTLQIPETPVHQTEQSTSSKRLLVEVTNYVEHKIPKLENDSNAESVGGKDDCSNNALNNLSGRQSQTAKEDLNSHMEVTDCADLNQQSNSGILTEKVSKTLNEELSDSDTEVKTSADLNQQSNFDIVHKKVSNTLKDELSDSNIEVKSSANLEKQNNLEISTEKLCKFIKEKVSDLNTDRGSIDLHQDNSNSLIDKVSNTIKEELSDLDNEMKASEDLSNRSNINLSNNKIEVQTTNATDESKSLTENCEAIMQSIDEPNQAIPSSSGTAANTKVDNLDKRSRDRCWYGKDCYRFTNNSVLPQQNFVTVALNHGVLNFPESNSRASPQERDFKAKTEYPIHGKLLVQPNATSRMPYRGFYQKLRKRGTIYMSGVKLEAKSSIPEHWDKLGVTVQTERKSTHHKKEFSHPGDSDHDSDPNDFRPICRYGAECYRKNKQHQKEYKHPTTSKKPPRKRREKRKTSNAKQLKTNTNESSEDDYDFDDPFFNDSEDEYENESWSEFDSDDSLNSNDSSEEDEDQRSLMKEAKRFTKQK